MLSERISRPPFGIFSEVVCSELFALPQQLTILVLAHGQHGPGQICRQLAPLGYRCLRISEGWMQCGKGGSRDAQEKLTSDLACCAVSPFAPETTDILAGPGGGSCKMHAF
jgi:hypothetical protein